MAYAFSVKSRSPVPPAVVPLRRDRSHWRRPMNSLRSHGVHKRNAIPPAWTARHMMRGHPAAW